MRKAIAEALVLTLIVASLTMVPDVAPTAVASAKSVPEGTKRAFEGRITAVNYDRHIFRMKVKRGIVKIAVDTGTRYKSPLHNKRDLHRGLRVHVRVKRIGYWEALKVARA